LVVHRLEVMHWVMQISVQIARVRYPKAGGAGALALLRKRMGASAPCASGLAVDRKRRGVQIAIRLHLLDGGEPALPHISGSAVPAPGV
jgi:hypothetical protein